MPELTLTSMLAGNADPLYTQLAQYLAGKLGIAFNIALPADWGMRQAMLDDGRAQIGALCGWPYTKRTDHLGLLAAPVMMDPRYGDRPIYFSDVIVRADSPQQLFSDLRGSRWALNEMASFSGHAIVCAELDAIGVVHGYFGSVIATGSHAASIQAVIDGGADAAAIDSTVLARALAIDPALARHIRTLVALGPSPIPPIVCHLDVPVVMRDRLRDALVAMHRDELGALLLSEFGYARFQSVSDADYDDIRRKAATTHWVNLTAQGPDRSFAARGEAEADRKVLEVLQGDLLRAYEAGSVAFEQILASDSGLGRRLIVAKPEAFASNKPLSVVGFFGQRNWDAPAATVAEIGVTDAALVREMVDHEHAVAYCSAELPDGNWGNLVIMAAPEGVHTWREGARHKYAAESLSARYYATVRLHHGTLADGLGSEQIKLHRTRLFDYRHGQTWTATRELDA